VKKAKVLLIDDEEEFVQTLVERLEIRGMEARACTSGEDAVQCLSSEPFDVVVADLKMPNVDGQKIMEIVKERFPGTRVILMTGHGAQPEGTPEIEGCILLKPFGIKRLVNLIEESIPAAGGNDE